jgi:hypothetical protein
LNLKIKLFYLLIFFVIGGASAQGPGDSSAAAFIPHFELPDSNYTNSGSMKISWEVPDSIVSIENCKFELQQSQNTDFVGATVRYIGPDLATYISGLKNGTYNYRVRSILDGKAGPWSEAIVVTVEHHSLKLAFMLFGLGAIVFIATVFVVVSGVRKQSSESLAENTKQGG